MSSGPLIRMVRTSKSTKIRDQAAEVGLLALNVFESGVPALMAMYRLNQAIRLFRRSGGISVPASAFKGTISGFRGLRRGRGAYCAKPPCWKPARRGRSC